MGGADTGATEVSEKTGRIEDELHLVLFRGFVCVCFIGGRSTPLYQKDGNGIGIHNYFSRVCKTVF